MKKVKYLFWGIIGFLILMSGCSLFPVKNRNIVDINSNNNSIPAPTKLILLTTENPPIAFMGKNGKITGLATDVVKEIMKRLDMMEPLTIKEEEAIYEEATQKQNIILFGIERTPLRENLFKWMGPIGGKRVNFYVKKDSSLNIGSLDEAKKVNKIAITEGVFAEQLLKNKGFINLVSFIKPRENIEKLIKGEVDLSVFTDLTIPDIVHEAGYLFSDIKPIYEIDTTYFFIAFSKKTSDEIVQAWQQAFDTMKQDGTFTTIYQRWTQENPPRSISSP